MTTSATAASVTTPRAIAIRSRMPGYPPWMRVRGVAESWPRLNQRRRAPKRGRGGVLGGATGDDQDSASPFASAPTSRAASAAGRRKVPLHSEPFQRLSTARRSSECQVIRMRRSGLRGSMNHSCRWKLCWVSAMIRLCGSGNSCVQRRGPMREGTSRSTGRKSTWACRHRGVGTRPHQEPVGCRAQNGHVTMQHGWHVGKETRAACPRACSRRCRLRR